MLRAWSHVDTYLEEKDICKKESHTHSVRSCFKILAEVTPVS